MDLLKHQSFHTRREFLQKGLVLVASSFTVPTFLMRTVFAVENPLDLKQTASVPGVPDDRILVVIQLGGGNDGLNTVVPFSFDPYYKLRPVLAIGKDSTLKLNDEIGLHPSLAKLKALYDEGRAAVVQGVGYPNPNRSHFRSMEIWETASDANKVETYGWIGRTFDSQCPDCGTSNPALGISIGRGPRQAFKSKQPIGIAVDEGGALKWRPSSGNPKEAATELQIFGDLNALPASGLAELNFLQRTALNARLSADKVGDAIKQYKSGITYPNSAFAKRMKLIAQMIAGKLPTKFFYVSHTGFDTHSKQNESHPKLLTELAEGIDTFYRDLKAQGNDGRVVLMTFSEFGRRVAENGSAGTDHGAAAPMFVIGTPVKGGVIGKHPSLSELDQGDLKMNTDFRSVYATLLDGWLGAKSETILGKEFPKLDLV